MRWPRMHGLPNRTSGSVVIRSRSESCSPRFTPRMHGLPNRTSGSVVIRSRSESWTAGIYTPYSYCIAVLTRSNRLTRRRFPWAHLPMSDEQIDRNLEELGQSFGLRLTDRPPSIQNLGGCPFVPQ